MTTKHRATYKFVDAQRMHRLHPDTFWAPCPRMLAALAPGDLVKVCHNNERFWVGLSSVSGDTLVGAIGNDLVLDQPFGYADEIEFRKRHVFAVTKSSACDQCDSEEP